MFMTCAKLPRITDRTPQRGGPEKKRLELLRRILGRRRPTLYQRCLAVHILGAGQLGALR